VDPGVIFRWDFDRETNVSLYETIVRKPCVHLGLQDYRGLTQREKEGEILFNRFYRRLSVNFRVQQM